MKRVVLDQGLPTGAAALLREQGWDAVHAREVGMREAEDSEILDYAARESRVVITLDRDFPQILALTSAYRPSVVLIREQRLRAADVAALLTLVWREYDAMLVSGCVLHASFRGTRVRPLPLR